MAHPSQAQIEANRRNARNGSGPNTARGKSRSSQNAIRHGLTGRVVVLPTEDMEVYNAFSKELVDSLNPETPMERQLAQTVADTQWRLNRARTYEDGMLALGHFDEESSPLHSALSAAKVFRDNSKAFVNLSLYEQRLSRQQKEAFCQLRDLQAERKATQPVGTAPMAKAASVLSPRGDQTGIGHDLSRPASGQGGEPGAIGFVFSDTEYDPGAFDPIFFKNSVPAPNWPRIENKKAA